MAGIKQLSNPAGLWGEPLVSGQPMGDVIYFTMKNVSGGTLAHGDVVIVDDQTPTQDGSAVTTKGTANYPAVIGVVNLNPSPNDNTTNSGTAANGAMVNVVVFGPARVQIAGNTVTVGTHILAQSGVAKQATGVAYASAVAGAVLGVPLESNGSKDANNTIRAFIKPS